MVARMVAHVDTLDGRVGKHVGQVEKDMGNGVVNGKGAGAMFAVAKDAHGHVVLQRRARAAQDGQKALGSSMAGPDNAPTERVGAKGRGERADRRPSCVVQVHGRGLGKQPRAQPEMALQLVIHTDDQLIETGEIFFVVEMYGEPTAAVAAAAQADARAQGLAETGL